MMQMTKGMERSDFFKRVISTVDIVLKILLVSKYKVKYLKFLNFVVVIFV